MNAIKGATKNVAPLAGAWIEIVTWQAWNMIRKVAPLAGAWIEISKNVKIVCDFSVAPLAGAWIEIDTQTRPYFSAARRSPCGSVD